MPDQPQTINVKATTIAPYQIPAPINPVCDTLLVVPARSATIQYVIGQKIPGTPAIPAVPGVVGCGNVLDAQGNIVTPAVQGYPAIPEVPATPDRLIAVDQGTIEMTDDEWNAWGTQDDTAYRTSVVAARLGIALS